MFSLDGMWSWQIICCFWVQMRIFQHSLFQPTLTWCCRLLRPDHTFSSTNALQFQQGTHNIINHGGEWVLSESEDNYMHSWVPGEALITTVQQTHTHHPHEGHSHRIKPDSFQLFSLILIWMKTGWKCAQLIMDINPVDHLISAVTR